MNDGNKSCFTCISLFRGCSFVETLEPAKHHTVDTLHPLSEDAIVERGALTGIRPTYTAGASLSEIKQEMERRGRCKGDAPGSHTSGRFSKQTIRILKTWLDAHADHPYPTSEEKETLRGQTGLNVLQISNWLANARRRGKVKPKRCPSPAIESRRQPQDIPSRAPEGYVPAGQDILTPFERWKESPPESDAPLTAIARAAESGDFWNSRSGESSLSSSLVDHRHSTGSEVSGFRATSSTSLDTGESSASRSSRFSLESSRGSMLSYTSFARKERRRRHRRSIPVPSQVPSARPTENKAKDTSRPFQCTFCVDTFRTKYDWMRHEKSLHLNLEKWICCPNGPREPCPSGHTTVCAYCRAPEPTADHIELHDHSTCVEKGLNARTFTRKDHLRQHLRLVHHVSLDKTMENWKAVPEVLHSRCGFCDSKFDSWDERAAHLARHFREGKTMTEWTGGWGFDPDVATHVADAMPPFMIEAERTKPCPWSAEKGDITMYDELQREHGHGPQGSTSKGWEVMGAVLSDYVTQCRERGESVTDKKMQDYARQCLYGSDDKWNQTRADNPEWLAIFKERLGLDVSKEVVAGEETNRSDHEPIQTSGPSVPFLAADLSLRCAPDGDSILSAGQTSTQPGETGFWNMPTPSENPEMVGLQGVNGDGDVLLSQLNFDGLDFGSMVSATTSAQQDQLMSASTNAEFDPATEEMMWSMDGDDMFNTVGTLFGG